MVRASSPPPAAVGAAASPVARVSRAVTREEPPRRRRPSPVELETCRQHYTRLLRSRREIPLDQQVPHRGPITKPSGGRFPVKLCGVRFGNLTPIPSHHELDPPPYTCFNCRRRCRGNGHKVMNCEETYLVHCENCGRRGVDVSECPRCSEAYFRDGWYLERNWGQEEQPQPGTSGVQAIQGRTQTPPRRPRGRSAVREVFVPEIPYNFEPARRSVATSPPPPPASPELEIVAEMAHPPPALAPIAALDPLPVAELEVEPMEMVQPGLPESWQRNQWMRSLRQLRVSLSRSRYSP